jgi:hypothetical protein
LPPWRLTGSHASFAEWQNSQRFMVAAKITKLPWRVCRWVVSQPAGDVGGRTKKIRKFAE